MKNKMLNIVSIKVLKIQTTVIYHDIAPSKLKGKQLTIPSDKEMEQLKVSHVFYVTPHF